MQSGGARNALPVFSATGLGRLARREVCIVECVGTCSVCNAELRGTQCVTGVVATGLGRLARREVCIVECVDTYYVRNTEWRCPQ